MNRCCAKTKTGDRCKLEAEENGLCHIHDPGMLYRQQQREKLAQRKRKKNKRNNKRTRRNGYVYMFWLGFPGTYKIGFSKYWGQRLIALRASNPNMKPVVVISGSRRIEQEIHEYLDVFCLEREIFQFEEKSQAIDAVAFISGKGRVDFTT